MGNPFRSLRERAAYEAGYQAGLADARSEAADGPPPPLTLDEIRGLSTAEINDRWPEIQSSLKAIAKGKS